MYYLILILQTYRENLVVLLHNNQNLCYLSLYLKVEYRCYVNKSKLIGISLFKPEYYSTRTVMPVEIIQHFTNQIIPIFDKLNLNKNKFNFFKNHAENQI